LRGVSKLRAIGVRLATDEWQDCIGIPYSDAEHHERLQATMYRHALVLLRRGVDVILEDGLWMKSERAKKFADARSYGALIDLHVFEVDFDTLWERLRERNKQSALGAAPINQEQLLAAWHLFQPVSDEELKWIDSYTRHRGGLD